MAPGREACGRGAPAAGHPSEGVALAEVSHAERAAGWRVAADRTCHNQAASTSLKETCMVYVSLREYGLITKKNCIFAEKPGICHLRR